jgi:diphosphomevalonate decarboxylase
MNPREVVQRILQERFIYVPKSFGEAFAPVNIALCKYWGKRVDALNIPVTDSLSIMLPTKGTHTRIRLNEARSENDEIHLNGEWVDPENPFAKRVRTFLDWFRPDPSLFYVMETTSNVPIGAGLASSASGFAALTLALNDLYQWRLKERYLSILARLGSGSAARSVWTDGFVRWHKGSEEDGMDSFAERLPMTWSELRVGLLIVSREKKSIGSRDAMRKTTETSALYSAWPEEVKQDMAAIVRAISTKDFELLGEAMERNARVLHALMLSATPPILYYEAETLAAMRKIWHLRLFGEAIYFTQDAGPNLKIFFLAGSEEKIKEEFGEMEIIVPFE